LIFSYLDFKRPEKPWIFAAKAPLSTIFRHFFAANREFKMCLCCHKDDLALLPEVAKSLFSLKKENHTQFLF
tara:strand:+ start:1754 stop:1969 length:216 start_codon:yes stop_codon:yes gene_type:complete